VVHAMSHSLFMLMQVGGLVGRTLHHANRPALIPGDPLPGLRTR
jgi:hypothetical protein